MEKIDEFLIDLAGGQAMVRVNRMMLLPLRENWALPFFWAQMLFLVGFLENGSRNLHAFAAATLGGPIPALFCFFCILLLFACSVFARTADSSFPNS